MSYRVTRYTFNEVEFRFNEPVTVAKLATYQEALALLQQCNYNREFYLTNNIEDDEIAKSFYTIEQVMRGRRKNEFEDNRGNYRVLALSLAILGGKCDEIERDREYVIKHNDGQVVLVYSQFEAIHEMWSFLSSCGQETSSTAQKFKATQREQLIPKGDEETMTIGDKEFFMSTTGHWVSMSQWGSFEDILEAKNELVVRGLARARIAIIELGLYRVLRLTYDKDEMKLLLKGCEEEGPFRLRLVYKNGPVSVHLVPRTSAYLVTYNSNYVDVFATSDQAIRIAKVLV